jgi:hypothetical protein
MTALRHSGAVGVDGTMRWCDLMENIDIGGAIRFRIPAVRPADPGP